jgi:hypothetical protein
MCLVLQEALHLRQPRIQCLRYPRQMAQTFEINRRSKPRFQRRCQNRTRPWCRSHSTYVVRAKHNRSGIRCSVNTAPAPVSDWRRAVRRVTNCGSRCGSDRHSDVHVVGPPAR